MPSKVAYALRSTSPGYRKTSWLKVPKRYSVLNNLVSPVPPRTESTSIGQGLLYKSRVRTEPTSVTAPQWTTALWGSLESLIEEMADCCVKVYTLEKVLKIKRDPVTDVVFLDEAMKVLENRPSTTFWASLGRSLEKNARDAAKGGPHSCPLPTMSC